MTYQYDIPGLKWGVSITRTTFHYKTLQMQAWGLILFRSQMWKGLKKISENHLHLKSSLETISLNIFFLKEGIIWDCIDKLLKPLYLELQWNSIRFSYINNKFTMKKKARKLVSWPWSHYLEYFLNEIIHLFSHSSRLFEQE